MLVWESAARMSCAARFLKLSHLSEMHFCLNSLKGVIQGITGIIMRAIKGDTRSSDEGTDA